MTEEKKEGCCGSHGGGCCGKKKFICGALFGILLFGAGYLVGQCKAGICPTKPKMCPVSGQVMSTPQAVAQ